MVGIQQFTDQSVAHFGTSLQAAWIKQPTIMPVPYSNTQVAVFEPIFYRGGNDYPKQYWCQNATLLDPNLDFKGRKHLASVDNMGLHSVMERAQYVH